METNLSLDDPTDFREVNIKVLDYFVVEFVAIPPDFDILNYLTLREQAGIFKETDDTNITHIKNIIESIKYSSVFAMLNNANISPSSCMYVLHVLNELGLVLRSIHNPIRKDGYKQFIKTNETCTKEDRWIYVNGQEIKRVNFVIVNIFNLMSEDVINESMSIAQNLQNYQKHIDEENKNLSNLDKE